MNKTLSFILFISLSLAPIVTFAALGVPFGGRVLTTPVPGATCPFGEPVSPYAITPIAGFLPGLFVSTEGIPGSIGLITPGSYILGIYNPVPAPECVSVPPFNNAFRTILYGTNVF